MSEQKSLEQVIMGAIDFCTHTRCKKCEYYGKDSAYDYHGKCRGRMMADRLRKSGVVVQRWIPVTERLPGTEKVLITNGDIVMRGYRRPDGVWKYGTELNAEWENISTWPVTHWMPLPEPPKEGE